MSDDEYDDEQPLDGVYDGDNQSLDDDLEEGLNSPAASALERLEAREAPTDEDADLTGPILRQLANQERIPFLVVQDGFFLGFELSFRTDLLGYDYLRRIFQSATRTHRSDRYISALELDSGGAIGGGGLLYSSDREGNYDRRDIDSDLDWETSNQQAGYEGVIDRSTRDWMVAEKKKLEAVGETAETNELLAFCIKELGLTTHQGGIKNADPESEEVRQRVWQAVEYAYEDMEHKDTGTDELRQLAAYFRKHVKSGRDYKYTGVEKFRFS